MIKIIHCADIHLGSKLEAKLPHEKTLERRKEVRATFSRMLEYAAKEGVRAVIIAGDAFDSDRPLKKDKEFFYDAVKAYPQIDFLYLRGNHDGDETSGGNPPENLKLFGADKWTSYFYGNVTVSALEITAGNAISMYSTLSLNPDCINIIALHGQTGEKAGAGKIKLSSLRNKNIDYLALGHIHSYSEGKLDERGRWAYSGCLEGRGFDETGEKGFVLLEIEDGVKSTFVPFAYRNIAEITVDITDTANDFEAFCRIREAALCSEKDLLRVNLKGEISYDNETLAADAEKFLINRCYFISVKNNTVRKINAEDYEHDLSLKGEFIRGVLANEEYNDDEKRRIISAGLKALSGGEVE